MKRGNKKCPNCGAPVPWSRLWLKSWLWAEWPCSQCKMILKFSMRRRLIGAMLYGLCVGLWCFFALVGIVWYITLPAAIAVLAIGIMLYWFFDSVKVKAQRQQEQI